jgi:hypothetical protein
VAVEMSNGREAILQAFDQLFDAAVGRLAITCTPEERAQARTEFAERMAPALQAVEAAQKVELPGAVVDDMKQSIERLSPADIAGLVASIPLAQRTTELLKAVAYERARQALLVQLTESAEPSPFGGH